MKIRTIATAASLIMGMTFISSCIKSADAGLNDASQRYFNSWLKINGYENATKIEPGIYVVESTQGTGASLNNPEKTPYVMVDYTARELTGKIAATTDEETAKFAGLYSSSDFYGPKIITRTDGTITAGVESALASMKVGGSMKVIIPGWLMTTDRYSTEEEYLKKSTGTAAIYDIKVTDCTSDIVKWELDSLQRFVDAKFPAADTLTKGLYYYQEKAPEKEDAFKSNDKVYILYTGRLLNGVVFDTNLPDTAKKYGLSPSNSGEPVYITWDESDYTNLTMGSDNASLIPGFTRALSNMKGGEVGSAFFISNFGYGSAGSSGKIPPYCPLRFDFVILGSSSTDE